MGDLKKIKVLYIAGSSRGGTTLLDRLIGQVDGFFSVGELRFIWERGFRDNQLCGCGNAFHDCDVWTEVGEKAFGDSLNDERKLQEIIRLQSSLRKLRYQPLVRSGMLDGRLRTFCSEYLRPLYSALSEVAGGGIIVDSSKTSSYLHVLSKCDFLDLYIVHLLRDPRAVAYSWGRKKPRPEIAGRDEFMPRVSSLRSSVLWMIEHSLISNTGTKVRKDRYMRLRYEDLAQNPRDAVRDVLKFVGVEDGLSFFAGENSVDLRASHTVSGNPMRFKTGVIDIRYDDEWTRKMAMKDRVTVSVVTYPLMRKFY